MLPIGRSAGALSRRYVSDFLSRGGGGNKVLCVQAEGPYLHLWTPELELVRSAATHATELPDWGIFSEMLGPDRKILHRVGEKRLPPTTASGVCQSPMPERTNGTHRLKRYVFLGRGHSSSLPTQLDTNKRSSKVALSHPTRVLIRPSCFPPPRQVGGDHNVIQCHTRRGPTRLQDPSGRMGCMKPGIRTPFLEVRASWSGEDT